MKRHVTLTVLAHDPGKTNYGIAVVQGQAVRNKLQVKVLLTKKLRRPLKRLKDPEQLTAEVGAYLGEVGRLVEKYKPDLMIFERFMSRGIKGTTIEVVNVMLGALHCTFKQTLVPIAAVTWKSQFKRRWKFDLDRAYKECKTEPHLVDATLMGIYLLSKELDVAPRLNFDQVLKAIEGVCAEPLINRVSRRGKN